MSFMSIKICSVLFILVNSEDPGEMPLSAGISSRKVVGVGTKNEIHENHFNTKII